MYVNTEYYRDKTILVTGGTGSIGSQIVRNLVKCKPKAVRVFDINETGLFDLEQEINDSCLRPLVGDIRDKDRLRRATEGADVIFHAAALKHVPLCEYNPFEAVKTNVVGTQNLLETALEANVSKFITVSTDKAVNPTSVMGTTKLLAERLTIAANQYKGHRASCFSVVRFGNVLNSRGSILTTIKNQVGAGDHVTLTDAGMTRFVMNIDEAVHLILKAGVITKGAEIFILKMPALLISDLIEVSVEGLCKKNGRPKGDIRIQIIGRRPGEKLFEELMTAEELTESIELDDMYVVKSGTISESKSNSRKEYNSRECTIMTKGQIWEKLQAIGYFD